MTDVLNDRPLSLGDLPDTAEVPAKVDYRLTISHGQFGVPEPLKLDGDLPLHIGDEVTALVRIRVTGRTEREPLGSYDQYTITTDAKIVEFVEVDGKPFPKPSPADTSAAETRARRAQFADRMLYVFLGCCFTMAALGLISGIVQATR